LVTVKGTSEITWSGPRPFARGVEMTSKNEVPVADEAVEAAPAWVAIVEAGLAKAAKYWTASEAQVEARDLILEEMDFDLDAIARKSYAPAWDVDRLYDTVVGPDNSSPQVRELVRRLTDEAGCRAHATAFLVGIPPRFVGGMLAAGRKAFAAQAAAAAEKVAS
jgi:hypothetical protein